MTRDGNYHMFLLYLEPVGEGQGLGKKEGYWQFAILTAEDDAGH